MRITGVNIIAQRPVFWRSRGEKETCFNIIHFKNYLNKLNKCICSATKQLDTSPSINLIFSNCVFSSVMHFLTELNFILIYSIYKYHVDCTQGCIKEFVHIFVYWKYILKVIF